MSLTFEFDLDADPVSGLVCDGDGHGRPFCGWMALTRAIENALDAGRRARGDDHPTAARATAPPADAPHDS